MSSRDISAGGGRFLGTMVSTADIATGTTCSQDAQHRQPLGGDGVPHWPAVALLTARTFWRDTRQAHSQGSVHAPGRGPSAQGWACACCGGHLPSSRSSGSSS